MTIEIPDGVIVLEPREVFDPCVVGFTRRPDDDWGRQTDALCAVYDAELCVAAMAEAWGGDLDGWWEFFSFNTAGAWIGEGTPTFRYSDA